MIFKLKNIFPQLKTTLLPDLKSLALVFSVCISIASCSEDPLSPPPNNDPGIDTLAMYEWSWDTISGYLLDDIYVVDSNNIFMVGTSNSMMYYNGETYTPIPYNDPTFVGQGISGYDESNVFISGGRYVPPGPAKPCLKVWDGSSFATYEFPNDSGDGLGTVRVTGYNQGWTCNNLYSVFNFNNGSISEYRVDSLIAGGYIHISQENEIYLFSSRNVQPPPHSVNIGYKLVNNSFDLIYRDSTINGSTPMNNSYFPGSPYFFRGGHYTINIFTNGQWSQLCNTYNFEPQRVCAATLDSVFCYGAGGVEYGSSIWFWNGIKWILESNYYYLLYGGPPKFPMAGASSQLVIVDKKLYLNFDSYNIYSSYLLKGKPIDRKEIIK